MLYPLLLFSTLFLFRSVFCQNLSSPFVFANDSSTANGTLPASSSAPFPTVEAQKMAADVLNATQSDNGTFPTIQSDPSNASNGSAIVVGSSLVEAITNSSMASTGNMTNGQEGGTPSPLLVPTPLSMQVQLPQKGSVVPQVPSSNFGNSPVVFEAQTCSSEDCSSRGTCIGTKSFPVCLCNGGSAGTRCQEAPCDPSVNCNSRGLCFGTLAIASCFCNIGFTGNQCQYQNGK